MRAGPKLDDSRPLSKVDVFGYIYDPGEFRSGPYDFKQKDGDYVFTIEKFPTALGNCPQPGSSPDYCGSVAQYLPNLEPPSATPPSDSDFNFELGGGPCTPWPSCQVTHPFWTMHAGFWNSWDQNSLTSLVSNCLNGDLTGTISCLDQSTNATEADILDNHQVDCIEELEPGISAWQRGTPDGSAHRDLHVQSRDGLPRRAHESILSHPVDRESADLLAGREPDVHA